MSSSSDSVCSYSYSPENNKNGTSEESEYEGTSHLGRFVSKQFRQRRSATASPNSEYGGNKSIKGQRSDCEYASSECSHSERDIEEKEEGRQGRKRRKKDKNKCGRGNSPSTMLIRELDSYLDSFDNISNVDTRFSSSCGEYLGENAAISLTNEGVRGEACYTVVDGLPTSSTKTDADPKERIREVFREEFSSKPLKSRIVHDIYRSNCNYGDFKLDIEQLCRKFSGI